MAKVKGYPGKLNVPAVTEDPRTENGAWYFYGDRHDKDSLSPIFDSSVNYNPDGSTYNDHGFVVRPGQRYQIGALQLSKQTTSVGLASTINTGGGDYRYDNNAMWSMDLSYQDGGASWKITNGTFTTVLTQLNNASSTSQFRGWPSLASTTNLSDVGPTSNNTGIVAGPMHLSGTPFNGIVPGFASQEGNDYHYPAYQWLGIGNSWPSSYTGYNVSTTNIGTYYNVQFLGISQVDQTPLYVTSMKGITTQGVQIQVQKVKWTTTTPTVTQMFTNTTVPTASGTSLGGNNMNNKYQDKFCSNWFVDPRDVTGNTRCFYFPYFDTNYNYHPFVVTWNITTDVFARETDITVATGGLSNTNQLVDISALVSEQPTHTPAFTFNETFVSGGSRYVTVMHFDTREQYPTVAGPRTFITYIVNAANPKSLTFHSKVTMPKTPRNLVWLNDAHTMMGVFMVNQFNIYTFNATTGWTLTTTIGEFVYSCGRDSQDRIWYLTNSSRYGVNFYDTHILTPSLPVSITISPELTNYEYAGTPLNSYVNVSAINAAGTRIATSVKLVIQGGSMTFSDNSVVKTVTTLTTGALQVNTIITGAGFTNIIASVEI